MNSREASSWNVRRPLMRKYADKKDDVSNEQPEHDVDQIWP